MRVGLITLLIIFLPIGLHFIFSVKVSAEKSLFDRGHNLASSIAAQTVDKLLVGDKLSLLDIIENLSGTDEDVLYVCLTDPNGDVIVHTYSVTFPENLKNVLNENDEPMKLYRTFQGAVMNVSVPVMSGQLGTVNVGLSRNESIAASRHLAIILVLGLVSGLFIIVIGARFITLKVSRPLNSLEQTVSHFSPYGSRTDWPEIKGTREVSSLADGFREMVCRLDALEHERKITEAHMVHTERLAALGELAAGLTHEIRNPLDGMLECVRYLESNPDNEAFKEKYLPMIRNGLQRINDVMRHMLTYARSGSETNSDACPTYELIDSLELMLKGKIEANNIHLTKKESLKCICYCNKHETLQASLNLVLNAIDAVKENEAPEIDVEIRCDPNWVYLTVEDNGPGIYELNREKVFEPFFTTKPGDEGTGLGLAISRQLMRAVGGDLELSAEPKKLSGASFIIRIPRVLEEECCNA
jgi:two-component system, NtrC family, sensor kinase